MTRTTLLLVFGLSTACSAQQPGPTELPTPPDGDVVADGSAIVDAAAGDTILLLTAMVRTPVVVDGRVPARSELPVVSMPLRDVGVELRSGQNNTILWSGRTDADGYVSFPATVDADVIYAVADASDDTPIAVVDCPLLDCDDDSTWAYAWQMGQGDTITVPVTDAAAGAFHIRDALRHAQEFMRGFAPERPATSLLRARWEPGSDTHCGTSCFGSGGEDSIFIYAVEDDTDEFDRQILMHEYTHFLEHDVFGSNGVGGFHDGSPAPPALAFSEGLCTGFASAASGSLEYIDTALLGGAFARYDADSRLVPAGQSPADRYSEETVAAFIASLLGPDGSAFHDAIGRILMEQESFTLFRRYAPGFDIGDFFDLLRCRDDSPDAVEQLASSWGFQLRAPIECPAAASLQAAPGAPDSSQRSPITPAGLTFVPSGDGPGAIRVNVKTDIEEIVVERVSLADVQDREVLLREAGLERGWSWSWQVPSDAVAVGNYLSVTMTMPGGAVYTHTGALRSADSLLAALPPVVTTPEGRRLRLGEPRAAAAFP